MSINSNPQSAPLQKVKDAIFRMVLAGSVVEFPADLTIDSAPRFAAQLRELADLIEQLASKTDSQEPRRRTKGQ